MSEITVTERHATAWDNVNVTYTYERLLEMFSPDSLVYRLVLCLQASETHIEELGAEVKLAKEGEDFYAEDRNRWRNDCKAAEKALRDLILTDNANMGRLRMERDETNRELDRVLAELERTLVVLTGDEKNPVGALLKSGDQYLSDAAKRVVTRRDELRVIQSVLDQTTRLEEREACAKMADAWGCHALATAMRERGK